VYLLLFMYDVFSAIEVVAVTCVGLPRSVVVFLCFVSGVFLLLSVS